MITESSINRIKESVVTYDVVSSFINLKKKGVDYVACCPSPDLPQPKHLYLFKEGDIVNDGVFSSW